MAKEPKCSVYLSQDCLDTCPMYDNLKEKVRIETQIIGFRRLVDVARNKRASTDTVNPVKLVKELETKLGKVNTLVDRARGQCEIDN